MHKYVNMKFAAFFCVLALPLSAAAQEAQPAPSDTQTASSDTLKKLPVPAWAFEALGQPVETRNFRFAEMGYSSGRGRNQWGRRISAIASS